MFGTGWAALGLYIHILPTSVLAQSMDPDTVSLTTGAPEVIKTGTFTNELDSVTLVVTAPVGSTLDFVVELNPADDEIMGGQPSRDGSNPRRQDVWDTARVTVAAGEPGSATPVSASCARAGSTYDMLDETLLQGVGGIQLAGIVETTWTFTVTYARPAAYSLHNNACNGKCTDATFELADLYLATSPPRTCPQIIDSYEPFGNDPVTHPCTNTLGAQPWRITVAGTPKPAVIPLSPPKSTGDGAFLQWQADPPVTTKDWIYLSSDLNDWPRSDANENLEASFAFATADAGMIVMLEYSKPPTATRKIGHTAPYNQLGFFFSTAHYDGTGPNAPTECGNEMQHCVGDMRETVPIDLWKRDNRQGSTIICELPDQFANAYAAPIVADESKVFIAMRVVESSSFPATPMVKIEYGTYCSTTNGNLCTYHWVSMCFQLAAIVVRDYYQRITSSMSGVHWMSCTILALFCSQS